MHAGRPCVTDILTGVPQHCLTSKMWLAVAALVWSATSFVGVQQEKDGTNLGGWAFAAPGILARKVDRLVTAGQRAMARGDHAEVERKLAVALRLDPSRAEAAFGRAIALSFMDDDYEARRMLQRTLALQPSHAGAREALSMLDEKTDRALERAFSTETGSGECIVGDGRIAGAEVAEVSMLRIILSVLTTYQITYHKVTEVRTLDCNLPGPPLPRAAGQRVQQDTGQYGVYAASNPLLDLGNPEIRPPTCLDPEIVDFRIENPRVHVHEF